MRKVIVSTYVTLDGRVDEVQDWVDLPFVADGESDRLAVSNARARSIGLTFRPLGDTVWDTAEWHRSRGAVELKAGMSRERETELLRKWPGQA